MNKLRIGPLAPVGTLLSWFTVATAAAQPTALRPHDVQAPTVTTSTTAKAAPAAAAKATPKLLTSDQIIGMQAAVGVYRQSQVDILADLISQTPANSPDLPDLWFRLAELHAQAHRFHRLSRIEAEIAHASATKLDKLRTAEKKELLEGIKAYRELTSNTAFANYPKMDQAIFYYGFTLQTGNYAADAQKQYATLLKNYPTSKFIPDALLAVADAHFEANRLADAEPMYRQLLKFPQARVYPYAMYKLAWVLLNQHDAAGALDFFEKVVQATPAPDQAVLHRTAQQDYVRAYAAVGKVGLAQAAFNRLTPGKGFGMLVQLADIYMGQGQFDKAIYAYRELLAGVAAQPNGKSPYNACEWQANVVQATAASGNVDTKVAELTTLVQLSQALQKAHRLPAAMLTECTETASALTNEAARQLHAEWAKTKGPRLRAHSATLYRLYLDAFPQTADAGSTNFYYAELLWSDASEERDAKQRSARWEAAAQAYSTCAAHPRASAQQQQSCALIATEAWQNVLATSPTVSSAAARPTSPMMLAAFDRYLALAAKTPPADPARVVDIKFAKADALRRSGDATAAIPIFRDILEHHSSHPTAEFAANLLLDIYNQAGRETELVALNRQLLRNTAFLQGKDDLAKRLRDNDIIAQRREAEALEKQGKRTGDLTAFVRCGEAYLTIYNAGPEAPGANEVLFNGAICFEQGRSLAAAITTFNLLRKYYPDDARSGQALARLGNMYADFAFYRQAADALEEYAAKYPGTPEAKTALSDAVQYRKGIGDDKRAIVDTEAFVAKYQNGRGAGEAAEAQWSLTAVIEKQGDRNVLIKHLRNYIDRFGRAGKPEHLIAAQTRLGQELWARACPVATMDGECVRVQRERPISMNSNMSLRVRRGSTLPTQCGLASKAKVTVVPRDAAGVKAAVTALHQAQATFAAVSNKLSGNALAAANYQFAVAQLHLAEVDFEAYQAIGFPTGLNFDARRPAVAAASQKRFTTWLEAKQRAGTMARQKYEAVYAAKEASNSIAAASRIGQIMQRLSDQLYSAEIPPDLRVGEFAEDKVANYCDALTEIALPLETKAIAEYGACLRRSTELGWFSSWSALCERELGQLRPAEFPSAFELRATPSRSAPVITAEAPLTLAAQ